MVQLQMFDSLQVPFVYELHHELSNKLRLAGKITKKSIKSLETKPSV